MDWRRQGRPLRVAHRGGAGLFPENTLAAFAAAVGRFGAEVLETDVRVTRDGRLVLFHDATVDRCTDGTGALHRLSWSEVAALDAGARFEAPGGARPWRGKGLRVPRLEEALEALPGVGWSLDLKDPNPRGADALAAAIRSVGAADRVLAGSEDPAVAARLAQALPEAARFFPAPDAERFVRAVWAGRGAEPDPRWTVLALPLRYQGMTVVTEAVLAEARRWRRPVWVWTVDDPADLDALIRLGVDGIVTDRPDRLAERLPGA